MSADTLADRADFPLSLAFEQCLHSLFDRQHHAAGQRDPEVLLDSQHMGLLIGFEVRRSRML
ncbi:hypothetical protein [Amycolatopsis sp. H20-H5]|uniref:hypothetical protein n=1 Tax=Amycolatopsis sp. H20-H5 TaxID=3046309 RepID=UPI002DB7FF6A|nr:hypothetical protein [Amycolatopsis sp. H20-H5]MEC3977748.1 hypothetical protein [Amycolatopsis sp. H20-H5]